MGESSITTQIARARVPDSAWVWASAVAIPLLLIAPALWNGYPLLQYDTGGYLARWYEGYLVPSRSTVFGLYLHFGEDSRFWINLGIQALATLWILQLTLRVFGMLRPMPLAGLGIALGLTTALPWLASMLLTDIFSGLSVLSLFILVLHGDKISSIEKWSLFAFTAFAAATHSATFAVLLGLCCVGWIARPFLRARIPISGLVRGSLTIVAGAAMLLSANFALSGKLAWTPGGYGVAFGRMLQDGIVARYLRDHCPQQKLKLCPYRNELPATADKFLWGDSMFNTLGRFQGMNDEMGFIVTRSLAEYPLWQARAASSPPRNNLSALQPVKASAAGSRIPTASSSAICRRNWCRCARRINSIGTSISPRSTGSTFRSRCSRCCWSRASSPPPSGAGGSTISRCSPRRCFSPLLGNAFVCGVISGPHDRYGSRLVWIATFVVLIAAVRHFARRRRRARQFTSAVRENPARPSCRPCRQPPACDRGWECRAPARPE